jgi:cytidylate kinase
MLRPFSSYQRGLFISVDGRSAGKSTIVAHLAQTLVAAGAGAGPLPA